MRAWWPIPLWCLPSSPAPLLPPEPRAAGGEIHVADGADTKCPHRGRGKFGFWKPGCLGVPTTRQPWALSAIHGAGSIFGRPKRR